MHTGRSRWRSSAAPSPPGRRARRGSTTRPSPRCARPPSRRRPRRSTTSPRGPIALARELLGDMLLEAKQPALAMAEYDAALKISPNRFKALQGAAKSAELAGDRDLAKAYYTRLLTVAAASDGQRAEVAEARAFVAR